MLPDLLKIDVEGVELAALSGAQQLLQAKKPTIFIEITETNFDSAADLLGSFGYKMLDAITLRKATPGSFNVVALHPSRSEIEQILSIFTVTQKDRHWTV
jgi:hypothetical protein